jgi:hypothetical protein
MKATHRVNCFEFSFDDEDVVNADEWIPKGEYNPHNVRPFLLHDHGFVVAVAFASSLQDAIDAAVDADKLDRFQVSEADIADYPNEEGLTFLGNASEPFDIEGLDVVELPNPPKQSFAAQFAAAQAKGQPS